MFPIALWLFEVHFELDFLKRFLKNCGCQMDWEISESYYEMCKGKIWFSIFKNYDCLENV